MGAVDIEPARRLNILFGDNAAGKTSLLECMIGLSRGRVMGDGPRSCRGPKGDGWRIEARCESDEADGRGLGEQLRMQWDGNLNLAVNGRSATARELSRQMIVAATDPKSHELFDFGPTQRRRFLDWALFHVEPGYAESWSRWRRILEQRNKALASQRGSDAIGAWDQGLVESAMNIHRSRALLVESIGGDVNRIVGDLFDGATAIVEYVSGWSAGEDYASVLQRQHESDQQAGRTRSGPQRADLRIRVGGMEAERLSRGQQKLLLMALMVSASRHVAGRRGTWPVLLLDDFESELGRAAQERLAELVKAYPGQSFVTQHLRETILNERTSVALFHVEHGKVTYAIQ